MGRIQRGFRLLKVSWGVVREDPKLLLLPLVAFVCSLLVAGIFAAGAWGIGLPEDGESVNPLLYVLGFFFYVAIAFVGIYFNAAMIGVAMEKLQGRDASIGDGLALARKHIGKIFVWAVITATVGMIIRALQERLGVLGNIIFGLLGVAWTAITFFVVPVLLYEPLGVPASIKRSASIFRERWGEQFTGNVAIGLAIFLISIPIVVVLGLVTAAMPIVGIPLLVIAIGIIAAVGSATTGVFNAALYRYATTGESSGAFSIEDMNATFIPKKAGSGAGTSPPGGIA